MSKSLAHLLVKQTAIDIACEVYEELAKDDAFFKVYPNEKVFMHYHLRKFIKDARGVLAEMLNGNYPESFKETIVEALIKQNTLPQMTFH